MFIYSNIISKLVFNIHNIMETLEKFHHAKFEKKMEIIIDFILGV